MGEALSLEQAAQLIKERTGRAIEPRSVRDVSLRIVVLQQWIERRTIEIVTATNHGHTDAPRDLEADLWSLPVTPPAAFSDHSEIVSDPRTGAIRRCPDCDGTGHRKCSRCGGVASLVCMECYGEGELKRTRTGRAPCGRCGGSGRIGCTHCTFGKQPCSSCNETGSTFTEQRARILWASRSQQMALSRPPSCVNLEGRTPVRVQTYEFEYGVFRPTQHHNAAHFRANVCTSDTEELDAIHRLVRQNPATVHERIHAQRAWVEQIEVWQIDAATEQEPLTLYAIGRERELVGLEALDTSPSPKVAIVALALGVIAILAASVWR